MTWKIVADSGCDYRQLENLAADTQFESVPLTLQVAETIYTDTADLDIDKMMEHMYATSTASKSACPSPDDYMRAFKGADKIFVVTITGALSGSHNAAQLAAQIYKEDHPDVQIHLIDSLSAGGEIDLIVTKLNELIRQNLTFEEVIQAITAYKSKLLFILAKVDNLVKNGRLNKLSGAMADPLNIRLIGEASSQGKLEILHKVRGNKKLAKTSFEELLHKGYQGGRIVISHRNNENFCQQFSQFVVEQFPLAEIEILPTSGVCSFYIEESGVFIGYEN